MKIDFPEGYELVFVPLALSWIMNFFLTFQVIIARKKYNVHYPNLYAPHGHKDGEKFNCVQRAHQNTLESWSMVMITMLAVGLVYPTAAALSGLAWVIGRFVYGFGYALGNPSFRMPGGILSHLGDFPLMGMAFRIAYNVVMDKSSHTLVKGFVKTHTGVEL
eukprot:gnl/MRDRNA2_/MRDRNA2_123576_c0_seq1.p1 gnl/MRDRNA2_/MRDRNA2_123576_c0~~gnl/MRDRNA2_/MRDRNA2_123576_c0_seq1.p1  ORF type:complete len:162 (+),score=20.25 gnl/MRDRNA2_/MRDRNA2_123576_c0_seq1:84-569(+)